ncbi:MAG: bifunctional DNA primase/polymerase, partial [Verrucomicrobia bacterium]|nr:bifunctional DNA primase/polymerase [Verrucomicrobiota bacterium]
MSQPQFDWEAARLYYLACRSHKHTAEHFGIKVATVKKRAAREHWLGRGPEIANAEATHIPDPVASSAAGATTEATDTLDSVTSPAVESTPEATNTLDSVASSAAEATPEATDTLDSVASPATEATDTLDSVTSSAAGATPEATNTLDSVTSSAAGATNTLDSVTSPSAESTPEATDTLDSVASPATEATNSAPSIPANINLWSRRESALYYHRKLGWAIHALHAFDQGTDKEKGKKPLQGGWRHHTAAKVKRKYIDSHFGADTKFNLGVIIRPPFVAVDLDSKEDNGESVRAWLATQPELASVPRERTGGGAHLHFRCPDLPETVLTLGKALTVKLADKVMAELYSNGLNLVLAPSVHKTGHVYTWEVTGEIPEVKWGDLVRWFGFAAPARKKRGRSWDPSKWWLAYEGDLRSIDMPGLCGELGWLGDSLDPDSNKWAVVCPWANEHSDHDPNAPAIPGSDAVIFGAIPGTSVPGFKCLHAHCSERTIEHFLAEAEKVVPGIVNRRCASRRERGRVKMEQTKLPVWLVPDGSVKLATESIRELADLIAPSHSMFVMNSEVVRLLDHRRQPYCTKRRDDETRHDFAVELLSPVQLITAIESFCRPVVLRKNQDGELETIGTVLKRSQAEFTIASSQFADAVPQLKRVLRSPVPSPGDRPGELIFPGRGYNPATGMFLSLDAVHALPLPPTPENIAWAKAALAHLLAFGAGDSFAYSTPQDECHSFARFLTPFCRGLMDWAKGPVWTFEADDPGTGKDTLADLTHVQQTGAEVGYSPTTDVEEMRKTLTSFLLGGGSFFHIGNVRGSFKSAPFEAATAASRMHQDRLLGQSKPLRLRNEAEYSFSANDAIFTPDILRRCRRIFQRWKGESVNNRVFRIRGIIGWTFRNRPLLATAALTLIQAYWRDRRSASSGCEFSSFPEWADIVGGLCVWAGFGNPTKEHLLDAARRDIGAPDAAEDRYFLRLLHEHTSGDWIKHGDAMSFAEQHGKDALPSVIWDRESTWRRQLGRKLTKLVDKERGPYLLQRRGSSHHQSRLEYRVAIREGHTPDEEDGSSSAFSGDWFQAPAVPCLDQAGNLALPGTASRPSPCSAPNCAPALIPPVTPEMTVSSNPISPTKQIQDSEEEKNRISCGYSFSTHQTGKTGQTGGATLGPVLSGANLPERHLCSSRADLDRVLDDLMGASSDRIALDIETHGPRKGDGLDPWRGDIRLLTLRREGGPVWMLDLMALG